MAKPRTPGARFGGKRRSDWKPTRPDWAVDKPRTRVVRTPGGRAAVVREEPRWSKSELSNLYEAIKFVRSENVDAKLTYKRLADKLVRLGVKTGELEGKELRTAIKARADTEAGLCCGFYPAIDGRVFRCEANCGCGLIGCPNY